MARNRVRGEVLVTLDEAINIAWGADRYRGGPRPTVEEALERIEHQLTTCGFQLAHRPSGTGRAQSGPA